MSQRQCGMITQCPSVSHPFVSVSRVVPRCPSVSLFPFVSRGVPSCPSVSLRVPFCHFVCCCMVSPSIPSVRTVHPVRSDGADAANAQFCGPRKLTCPIFGAASLANVQFCGPRRLSCPIFGAGSHANVQFCNHLRLSCPIFCAG